MNVRFIGDSDFLVGLTDLQAQLRFTLDEKGLPFTAIKTEERVLRVKSDGQSASVTYYDKASFFHAFSLGLQTLAEGGGEKTVRPLMRDMGSMQNCSRSACLKTSAVKELIRQHAIMGYNFLELYTETSYEIDGEPYFGYQAPRYTHAEIKEMVAYSKHYGVEIVPCIQTLAHLSELFGWGAYGAMHDVRDTVLVDHPKTYDLIEKMIKTVAECFDTNRINLGMDEAYFMGTGRYNWFIDESKPDVSMLFIRHLKRVLAIADKYGFTRPAIWFDNLFGINYKGYIDPPVWLWKDFKQEIRENFPKVQMIFWNYVIQDTYDFERFVGYIRQLSEDVSFASMAHGYTSFAPENGTSRRLVDCAREGCKKCDITEFLVTWWGTRIPPFTLLPALYAFAEGMTESEGVDMEARCKFLFGYTYTEFCKLDLPNLVGGEQSEMKVAEGNNLSFYALANEPLMGMLDRHVPDGAEEEFARVAKELDALSKVDSPYSYLFAFERELCDTLSVRAELGKKIKRAYDQKDLATLGELAKGLPSIADRLRAFHKTYRSYFLSYNKSHGVEFWDNAFGAISYRLEVVKTLLEDYIAGKIATIDELDAERLPISAAKDGKVISWRDWNSAAKACIGNP